VIAQGGRVWVQEAGQSNFTSDWVKALIELGVSEAVIKNNVIVVQHSDWNESKTSPEDLAFVKLKTNYQAIDDGNKPKRLYNNKDRRGPFTPMYVDNDNKYLKAATSKNNSNRLKTVNLRQIIRSYLRVALTFPTLLKTGGFFS